MTAKIEYPPGDLYQWNFKEDDGRVRLIGTDPALGDAVVFRWIDEPQGWERREPWPARLENATLLERKRGAASGWPGSIPLLRRPVGRPRKEEIVETERRGRVTAILRRDEVFEIMRRASAVKRTIGEWAADVLRARLREDQP